MVIDRDDDDDDDDDGCCSLYYAPSSSSHSGNGNYSIIIRHTQAVTIIEIQRIKTHCSPKE
jgi:hypothetical protein